jgi:threonine dehydrogenase-like Zn-dependent dehydrogenase
MKAVGKTKREPGIEVIQVERDRVGEEEVLLAMRSASICGSDLGFYDFTPAYQKFAKVPVIMGHEFSGEIVEIGKSVSGFSVGERVVCESVIYCGKCRFCRMGMTNICANFTVFGMHRNGGFSEFVSVDSRFLHKIPDEVSFVQAGIVEPLSVVVNGLDETADVRVGETAAIIGPGPLGLLSAEVLKSKGVSGIFVLGISVDAFRLETAREKLGYKAIDSQAKDAQEMIKEATDGYGCDLVVVAAGAAAALKSALSLVSKGGQIIVLGIFPEDISLPVSDMVRRQLSMEGSYGSRWVHYEQAIALLKHRSVRAEAIVTHRFTLDQAREAFETAKSKAGCKIQFYT